MNPDRTPQPCNGVAAPQTLRQALGLAAADLARQEPPPFERIWPAAASSQAAISPTATAPAAVVPPGPRTRRLAWGWAGTGPFLVGATVLGSLVLVLQPWRLAPAPAAPQVVVRDGWDVLAGGFVPVAGAERWVEPGRGVAAGWIVRTELPAERLAGLGLPFDPARASERVPADLLLHDNGELLAVRVLP
jgi:hypothetical protein